jgi:hypothetical protein
VALPHGTLTLEPVTSGAHALLIFHLLAPSDAPLPGPGPASITEAARLVVWGMQRWASEDQGEALLGFQLSGKLPAAGADLPAMDAERGPAARRVPACLLTPGMRAFAPRAVHQET